MGKTHRLLAFTALWASAMLGCGSSDSNPIEPVPTPGTPGITVAPTSGLTTTEAGGTATFTVVLNAEPTVDVEIALSSSDLTEGTVKPASVKFTSVNWKAPQTVTITGVDDTEADGNQAYKIITAAAKSTDTRYAGKDPDDVSVTNTDNESAGITVTPTKGLTTTEAGGTDTFTVVLNTKPTGDVTIALTSSDTTEGTVSPSSLKFTADNWKAPQTVTAKGVDDTEADGNIVYNIVTAAAKSTDARYEGVNPDDVEVTNTDNETAGITVKPTSGLKTTEAGGTATFTIVLNTAPTAGVTIALSSSDTTEGTVSPASVVFTTSNWKAPQTVTVTGVDDNIVDGDQPYKIVTAAATSTDTNYNKKDAADVDVTNTDNESPGVDVTPTTGLTTTEAGGTATFTVVLKSQPTGDVTIPVSSDTATEGTVSTDSLVFTAANWNAPQTVTVTGVDDLIADGDQKYKVLLGAATSTDTGYDGVDPADVELTNTDNDSPGITVTAATDLTTTEAGATATFTVVLNTQPTADVTLAVSSNDTTEGTVAPATLTFTTANWAAPQTVTVTGVDDSVADGNQLYAIVLDAAASTDLGYNGIDPKDVDVTNTDNDSAGVTITPLTGLKTSEQGGTATFTVVLNTQPSADVLITLSSSDATEGTVSPAALTFTSVNWNAPQTVTATGVDDLIADGDQPYTILTGAIVSSDATYNGVDPANVSVTNTDNDSAGITVTPVTGLVTTEAGGTATFTVVLNTQPTANVVIALSSSDITEGTVSPASLTFTAANWNAPQTVTATGVDDSIADGNQPYSILTAAAVSTDASYSGMDAANVSVSNTDNDSAGITVTPVTGLTTTEAGGTATFTIVLNSQPTADVTVALSSSDTTEGTVSPVSLTFTSANWSAPQTVTVTGVDDSLLDGNQPYTILTAAAVSTDATYSGVNPTDVNVTNTDNDTAGITVSPTTGLITTEKGGTATFTVVLNAQPAANVAIGLTSSNVAEGTVSPASLTFTPANWNAPQVVTLTGVDDAVADGAQVYTIVTTAAVSTDANYNGINPSDVTASNTDDDSPGVTISQPAKLTTTESGGVALFSIVLNSQPTANVTIALTSSDLTEGTVSPASVTFTPANWAAPQFVTVTGVDDAVQDGNQPYFIVTAPAVSTDAGYSALNALDVSVTNNDNDTPGVTVGPTFGLTTTEAGGTTTFTVVLNSQPTANVLIDLSSSDGSEGVPSPASLTFTAANWNAPQTVTITGVDDAVQDGNQLYKIITAAANSADPGYQGLDPVDVDATNIDNDSAGITVTPITGLTTTEAGGTATFTVRLNSEPTANVTIALSSSDITEGTVGPVTLTFTNVNWNAPQTVTVTGVNDDVQDGNQPYTIVTAAAVSTDLDYNGLDAANVSVTNTDNDSAGVTVTPLTGLVTTEAGGTATFSIHLNSEPTANVTIALSSSDLTEGTVAPVSLTFTPINWNAPQTVTVTGVDDLVQDGNQPYTIVTAAAVSADPGYSGIDAANVSVANTDNDSAGITVTPVSGLVTTEAGGTATFTVVLNSEPTANVTIPLTSSDLTEGTVAPASLVFTPVNWNAPQTVTVTGVDDAVQDGNQAYTILTAPAVSTDTGYSGMDAANVAVSNTDNDSAGITVTPVTGLITTEAGGTATFTIVLNSEPTANVVIALSSNDSTEGTVAPLSLTFTPINWKAPQTVTVTGVDDFVQDGNQAYSILTAAAVSTDANYNGMDPANVSVTNTDNDSAGITVVPTTGLVTTEAGGTATFTIVLNSQPVADVTIALSSNDLTEGTVSPASVTFTAANWNAPRTITVTGVNDDVQDGNQPYTILTAAAVSTDANYSAMDAANVSVTNTDNDSAGITVSPTTGLITTEAGGTTTFTIVLNSEPTAAVTIGLSSSDITEGTVLPLTLTFTPLNWNAAQTVTLKGVDDAVQDGNQPYTIVTSAATSSDPNYSGLDAANVSVSNTDNDSAGVTVTPVSGLVTTEAGGTATFTIVLNSEPTANVVINLGSSDLSEGNVTPAAVTFTPLNWNAPQTVTVTGVDDFNADGNQPYSIVTSAATSGDANYQGSVVADVSVTNTDNDTAGIVLNPASGNTTTEAAGVAVITIVLSSQPTANVTIPLSSSDTTEGTLSTTSVTFTPANWNVPQAVAMTGVDDPIADGNQLYYLVTDPAISSDPGYAGLDAINPTIINVDNDSASITVTPTSGLVTTEAGGTATFTIVLNSMPSGNVFITLQSSDLTEGSMLPANVTFTPANWNVAHTITVTGIDDFVKDGDQPYLIQLLPAVSSDLAYNGLDPVDVAVSNKDND